MVNMGEIIPETGYFLLRTKVLGQLPPFSPHLMLGWFQENSRRKRSLGDLKKVFRADAEVDWSEFQVMLSSPPGSLNSIITIIFQAAKVRVKRDPIRLSEGEDKVRREPVSDSYNYKFDRRLVDNLLPRKVNS